VIGGSGSGKSTLLREMILLQTPSAGSIRVLGVDLQDISERRPSPAPALGRDVPAAAACSAR
jgi:ABC-type transporter Mla maintaining outer membrane lipid asymmetry ATPase subunit MlaF